MNELPEIESHVEDIYFDLIKQYNTSSTGLRIDTLHVSDFTQECLRKSYYGRTQPKPPFDKIKAKIFWLGNIVHEHALLSQVNELTMCYDVVQDVSYPPMVVMNMSEEEKKNIITGSLDDLINYKGEYIIGDKKTWNARGWDKQNPDPLYVLQLNIYRVLLWESWHIDATSGCLLYLDKSNDLDPKPMAFRLQDIAITKQYLRDTIKVLQQDNGPKCNPCWLCNGKNRAGKIYCDYSEVCNKETDRQSILDARKATDVATEEKTVNGIIDKIKTTTKLEDFPTKEV